MGGSTGAAPEAEGGDDNESMEQQLKQDPRLGHGAYRLMTVAHALMEAADRFVPRDGAGSAEQPGASASTYLRVEGNMELTTVKPNEPWEFRPGYLGEQIYPVAPGRYIANFAVARRTPAGGRSRSSASSKFL